MFNKVTGLLGKWCHHSKWGWLCPFSHHLTFLLSRLLNFLREAFGWSLIHLHLEQCDLRGNYATAFSIHFRHFGDWFRDIVYLPQSHPKYKLPFVFVSSEANGEMFVFFTGIGKEVNKQQ